MSSWIQGTWVGDGLLPDRFRIRQPLGQGAQGQVYLAWDRLHERDVALKRLESDADCLREARALARIRHPNVVTVYELVHQVDPPYLVMQYVEGEELELRLQRTGPLSPRSALVVARSVAAALAAAHAAGVLHRDLKPANVMLQDDGEVTLIDFGIARGAGDGPVPHSEQGGATVLGTPLYLAPEVLAGQPADEQSEIYAVGVMLYRMLTGRYPYEAETLEQLRDAMQAGPAADVRLLQPTVPVPLADVVAACLAPRAPTGAHHCALQSGCSTPRASRHPSAVTLLRELERVGQRGVRALPATPYIGLLPLTTEAGGVFFGREEEVARVLGRLRAASTVTLVGASGAGKSSLAMAGVAAAVLAGDLDRRRWRVERMTPGQRPLSRLAECLAGCTRHDPRPSRTGGDGPAEHLERELRQSPGRWWRLLDTIEDPRGGVRSTPHEDGSERPRGLLLVVDQLEELVTLCSDAAEQRGLGQALCGSLAAAGGVRVLVTARDDFLARLGAVEGLAEVLETIHIVRPLDGEGLRAAVVEPARAFGFTFEDDAMVEQIVTELAGRSGTMPLLGFALQRLWEQRDEQRRIIPRAALDRMGGIGAALARAADEVVELLTRHGLRSQTRQVLLELLTPQGTKRSRVLEDLLGSAEGSREVVSRLREARLVTGGDTALELAHEALASEWSLLRRWIDESRARRELAADALHAARRWQQRGRVSDLLWRGAPLQEARNLPVDSLSTQAAEFVEASRRHARRQRLLRWLLLGVLGLTALATAGIYVRHLKLQRDMARRQTLAERQALTAQRELARAERGRGRAEEERRQLLEAWIKERKQLLADLNRTEQSGLRQHILRRLTDEDPPLLRQLPRPAAAAGVDVCLFGPAHDLSMAGDWASKTRPVALTLREAGHVIGCEYPYVRAAFPGAARHGLLQYAGDLPRPTLDWLVGLLRRRFPGLELKRVAGKRLFRTVDILLPD